MGHSTSNIYEIHYQNPIISMDTAAAFLGEEPRKDRQMHGSRQVARDARFRASFPAPDAAEHSPELQALWQRRETINIEIRRASKQAGNARAVEELWSERAMVNNAIRATRAREKRAKKEEDCREENTRLIEDLLAWGPRPLPEPGPDPRYAFAQSERLAGLFGNKVPDNRQEFQELRIEAVSLMVELCSLRQGDRRTTSVSAPLQVSEEATRAGPDIMECPTKCAGLQCPECLTDTSLSKTNREKEFSRPQVLWNHFASKHLLRIQTTIQEHDEYPCPFPGVKGRPHVFELHNDMHVVNHYVLLHNARLTPPADRRSF